MRRLIYAPKAYIFVRSSNLGGKIFDVTSDVVRGEVHQKTGDLSSARFELRNRYQKWLRDPDNDNKSIFLPMDMVTIWLQRVAGRPVQVFTGYLDEVPYYQGYPQNAIFGASCTLKKLAYTWFDPGLQTFFQWVKTNDGWFYDPSSGEGLNAQARTQGQLIPGTAALANTASTSSISDTGFANLLGRFMTDIAGWAPEDVLISELHTDIPKIAAQLFDKITADTAQDLKALEQYMATALGIKGFGVDPATPTDANNSPTLSPTVVAQVAKMKKVADANNIPLLVLVFAAFVLTNFDETYQQDPTTGNPNWGYGVYALQPKTTATQNGTTFGSDFIPVTADIDGKKPTDLLDIAVATQVFCKRLNANQGAWVKGARANNLDSVVTWVTKALGRNLPKVDLTSAFNSAKTIATAGLVTTPPTGVPGSSTTYTSSWSDPTFLGKITAADKQTVQRFYQASSPWLAALVAPYITLSKSGVKLAPPPTKNINEVALTGTTAQLQSIFNGLKGDSTIDSVSLSIAGANEPQSMKKGVVSNVPTPGSTKSNLLVMTQTSAPASSVATVAGSGTSSTTNANDTSGAAAANSGAITFQQLASFSANAAFAANFAFPTNVAESALLTGDRALMNDISCLDAVKQFCQGSLRTFRSLPDGRFLAFYPDYFGAYRKPYWQIYNIEITDFGIQLNDEALATHVYVVGDTFDGDGQITMMDDVSTRGVATITQAFMLNSFIEQYDGPTNSNEKGIQPAIGRLKDAYSFLQHYGARPHKEEQPIIRNVFYEFLMAWQKFMYLWAQQFATTVSFTFQPEVMSGGLISFPDHGIQMYCEEVTHTWDYASGFDTEAVLTAPSLLKTVSAKDRAQLPGFALGGNINTVGVAS